MPVRPPAAQDLEDGRGWVWPQGDGSRLPRYTAEPETVARRGSLHFIRELRLWEQEPDRQLQSLGDPAHLCDEEDAEETPVGPSNEGTDMDIDTTAPQPLQPSNIFREGAVFRGSQSVSRASGRSSSEDWGVVVTINEIDLQRGWCSGDMMAENVPLANAPVVTHWEGELIDGLNHSFVTCKWGATYTIDLAHWGKFRAFTPLNRKVEQAHGRCARLHELPYIFMRWKERFFVHSRDEGCSLTIAGFYYICISRESGAIEGYYYDPNSTPYQKLELKLQTPNPTSSSYRYA